MIVVKVVVVVAVVGCELHTNDFSVADFVRVVSQEADFDLLLSLALTSIASLFVIFEFLSLLSSVRQCKRYNLGLFLPFFELVNFA